MTTDSSLCLVGLYLTWTSDGLQKYSYGHSRDSSCEHCSLLTLIPPSLGQPGHRAEAEGAREWARASQGTVVNAGVLTEGQAQWLQAIRAVTAGGSCHLCGGAKRKEAVTTQPGSLGAVIQIETAVAAHGCYTWAGGGAL